MPVHMLPDPEQTAYFRRHVDRPIGPMWALGWMHKWVVDASREHAATCRTDGCETCKSLISALSLFAAVSATMPQTPEVRATLVRLHRDGWL